MDKQGAGRTPSMNPYNRGAAFPCPTRTFLWTPGEKGPRKPDFRSGRKTRRRKGAAYDRSFCEHSALRAAGRARTGPPGGRVDDGGAHRRGARHRAPFAVPARRPALVRGRPLLASRVPARIDAWLGAGVKPAPAPGRVDLTGRAEWRLDACGPGRQASAPRRPASGPAATAPGNGEGAHEVTARDHPAPAPAGIQWTAPAVAQSVDRRVVVSPAQARKLLTAVRGLSDRGAHLEAFYARLYYAALRPSEAVMLRESDLYLPAKGWGRIVLAASASRAGTAWTDHGTSRQERGLKHRADNETRTIPIPPELVRLLRAHIRRYGTTPDGRVFQTTRGGIIQDSAYSAVWAEARKQALTEAQFRSPLGRRPYDLRHAAVSLWLNSGVPATEVARRAGHGVAVLLKIYAHCIDGQADAANQRITDALGTKDTQPEPGGGEDGEGEMAS
jgi:integrase